MVVLYIEARDSLPQKMSPKNQPHISFIMVWQYWLGIAEPQNFFRLILNPFNKLL